MVDALSLLPYMRQISNSNDTHLDIGSGSGFPVMVMALASPGRGFVGLERSEVKYGFLEKVKASCGLNNLEILCGSFPVLPGRNDFATITARAVEKPRQIEVAVASHMRPGSGFLCQSGDPQGFDAGMFHVEPGEDWRKTNGLRRGALYVIQKTQPSERIPRGKLRQG